MSDTIFYPKQFRIRNPIRQSLPKNPSERIVYPKPFRIKNPIRRGFLKKTLSDRISYPKPFRIENPIRIARRMKSSGQVLPFLCTMGLSPFKNCIRDICPFAPIFQGINCFRLKYLEITLAFYIYLGTS